MKFQNPAPARQIAHFRRLHRCAHRGYRFTAALWRITRWHWLFRVANLLFAVGASSFDGAWALIRRENWRRRLGDTAP